MSNVDQGYIVYSDGGSRGNPGPAAFGFVIYNEKGDVVSESSRTIGITTNNQAEYQGIVAALESLVKLGVTAPVVCKLDSQLVVRQINGAYKMKSIELKPWLDKVTQLRSELVGLVTFIDIPRAQNKVADSLVNQALDKAETQGLQVDKSEMSHGS